MFLFRSVSNDRQPVHSSSSDHMTCHMYIGTGHTPEALSDSSVTSSLVQVQSMLSIIREGSEMWSKPEGSKD